MKTDFVKIKTRHFKIANKALMSFRKQHGDLWVKLIIKLIVPSRIPYIEAVLPVPIGSSW